MTSQAIGVDCTFQSDGCVRVRRIMVGESWQTVEQGRQWQDEEGRHVLVMRPGQQVEELLLEQEGLRWFLKTLPQTQQTV